MFIYLLPLFLVLWSPITIIVSAQISLNRLQDGEVIINRHPDDPQPRYHLPTLIVPGSIEYQTTVDGVVIKFTTAMELTRTSLRPTASLPVAVTGTSPDISASIAVVSGQKQRSSSSRRPTKLHEGVIEVYSGAHSIVSLEDPDSMIPVAGSRLSVVPSSIATAAVVATSRPATVSVAQPASFTHTPTPVLPAAVAAAAEALTSSISDHPYASFFPLPFQESPFEALRSKSSSISSTSSSSGPRAWRTLTSPQNPWRRLFSQQIHASKSITGQAASSSSASPLLSSREAHRVRLAHVHLATSAPSLPPSPSAFPAFHSAYLFSRSPSLSPHLNPCTACFLSRINELR